MQFARGGELYEYVNERKKLSDNEARKIFRQISTAIYYCHKVRFRYLIILLCFICIF